MRWLTQTILPPQHSISSSRYMVPKSAVHAICREWLEGLLLEAETHFHGVKIV